MGLVSMPGTETHGSEARLKQDYLEGMIRLGIWYVRQLLASGRIAERHLAMP